MPAPATTTITILVSDGPVEPVVTVYAAVRTALADAIGALRAAPDGRRRMAISVGEAAPDALTGSGALTNALDLFATCSPGELVMSATARGVLGAHRHPMTIRADGTALVDWREQQPTAPLPAFLAGTEILVGRDTELERANALLREIGAGPRRGLILRGEAGIGKTALAGAVARAARAAGFTVLAGRCTEDLALHYQPVAEAFGPVFAELGLAELQGVLGPVARFLPAVFPRLGPVPQADASGDTRGAIADALRRAILHAVAGQPTVLIVDDVQWARPATVHLLADLIRSDGARQLFLLLTQRSGEAVGVVDAALEALAEDAAVEAIDLPGLAQVDIAELVAVRADGMTPHAEVVADIHRRSAGNPFFAEELAFHMAESPAGDQIPDSLREVVMRRVEDLGPTARAVLTAGAVVGAPFSALLVSRLVPDDEAPIADLLRLAVRRGIVVETDDDSFDFKHALARDALAASLTRARRRQLHARIAAALDGEPPDLFAHHLALGASLETLTAVVDAAIAAAAAAYPHWTNDVRPVVRRAVEAMELDPKPRRDRALLLTELAQLAFFAGDMEEVRTTNARAAAEARAVGDVGLLAAALKDWGLTVPPDLDEVVRMAEDALKQAGTNDIAIADASTLISTYLGWRGNDVVRAAAVGEDAYRAAVRLDDALRTTSALVVWLQAVSGTPSLHERRRLAREYMERHRRGGTQPSGVGLALNAATFLSAGDRDGFDAACERTAEMAAARAWWQVQDASALLRACQALLDGDLGTVLSIAMGQLGSSPLESVNPVVVFAGLAWREFGRTADLIPMISAIGPDQTTHRLVPTLLLVAHAELRDHDRARPLLDAVAADDFAGLFTTFATGTTLALCAEACWLLGDRARAAQLRRHLEPYRGQVIVIPIAAGVLGAADHFLGLLAHTLDDRETAAKELEAALAIHRGIRSPLLIGHSAVALARVLDDDDPRRAALLGEAADIARRLTLPRLATSVDQAQPGGGD